MQIKEPAFLKDYFKVIEVEQQMIAEIGVGIKEVLFVALKLELSLVGPILCFRWLHLDHEVVV